MSENPAALVAEPPVAPAPITPWRLFSEFTRMGLSGFGGVLPFVRRSVVERNRWLTEQEFAELIGIGQVLPGPNVVNFGVMFGWRVCGWQGALAASLGVLLVPLLILLALVTLYQHMAYLPAVRSGVQGMLAVTSGLIIATGLKMLSGMAYRRSGLVLAAIAFVLVGVLRWSLPWVLLGMSPISLGLAWYFAYQEKSREKEPA